MRKILEDYFSDVSLIKCLNTELLKFQFQDIAILSQLMYMQHLHNLVYILV